MVAGLAPILAPYFTTNDSNSGNGSSDSNGGSDAPPAIPEPLSISARRWGGAFTTGDLQGWSRQDEDCICLEPWRIAIAGDFVRPQETPLEAAALSGLQAGERIAAMLAGGTSPA